MIAALLVALLQFTPQTDHRPGVVIEGNFRSCRDADGEYSERAQEYTTGGRTWNIHLGPRDEFAIFRGPLLDGDAHRDHADPRNLLGPAYRIADVSTWRGKRNWTIPSLALAVSITQAGGSRDDCDSFWVLVTRTGPASLDERRPSSGR